MSGSHVDKRDLPTPADNLGLHAPRMDTLAGLPESSTGKISLQLILLLNQDQVFAQSRLFHIYLLSIVDT